jgi:hypothetical protein
MCGPAFLAEARKRFVAFRSFLWCFCDKRLAASHLRAAVAAINILKMLI